jgi:hypothetical protein
MKGTIHESAFCMAHPSSVRQYYAVQYSIEVLLSVFTFLDVNMSSVPSAPLINRGNLWVPPAPGMIAKLVSTNPKLACVKTMRMSVARAISNPQPKAAPYISDIVGIGK